MGSLKAMLHYQNDFCPKLKLKMTKKQITLSKPQCGFRCSMLDMASLKEVIQHPNELYPLLKMNIAMKKAEKQLLRTESHWKTCYSLLHEVSTMCVFFIEQLGTTELRDAVCVLYLVLRALDNVEDDPTIPNEIKAPILKDFHRHIYNPDYRSPCGPTGRKVVTEHFRDASTAFLELNESYQKGIENTVMRMGAGMAKFICKKVETMDDYKEYCGIVASLMTVGLADLIRASGMDFFVSDSLTFSSGYLPEHADVIKDYMEDINARTDSCHWPREIWSKYANKVEDFKYEENSEKAIQCLNEMVTNALVEVDDTLKFMSELHDPVIFKFFAVLEVIAMGDLALCYNNIQVFRSPMIMRRGLMATLIDRTNTMADAYGAFYDFSSVIKSKVDMNDPNAKTTISRIDAILKTCRDSGTLSNWNSYVV